MNDRHIKFCERQEQRKRDAQHPAVINADLVGRSNQKQAIQRWAERVQAEG